VAVDNPWILSLSETVGPLTAGRGAVGPSLTPHVDPTDQTTRHGGENYRSKEAL